MTKPTATSTPYTLRRSPRAQKTRIVVTVDKIEVVAPLKVSEQRIKAFVAAQQTWIQEAIKRIGQRAQALPTLKPSLYTDGAHVPCQGQKVPLTIKPTSAKTVRVQLLPEQQFLAYLPVSTHPDKTHALIKQALEQWMKQQTRHLAQQFIDKHSPRHQLFPRSLRIKAQKTRWGSCGPNDDINLNWLLMLAPPVILEYVVVHELCHIKHKNHSGDFWLLLSEHMPDYPQHRRWLKQHGASLMQGL